jgi:Domain of unknown function (DUF929)
MGKATRIRQQNAREKIAAQRAAARRSEVRRRALWTGGAVVLVIAIVVAIVAVKLTSNNSPSSSSGGVTGTLLPASVQNDIKTVPASALNTVGVGSILSYNPSPLETISNTPLTANGKPEMLFIGAEFCPFCGAERWAIAVALNRFGHFTTPFRGIHSSSTDTDPNTPTLTFYKSSYTSPYLTFTPVENENDSRGALQNTTSAQQALWVKYDSSSDGVGYPFIDFGNKYILKDPTYDPGTLAGMTWAQVAAALHDPSSTVAKNALGAANLMTAAICKMTGDKPGNVCSASGVVAASAHL